MHPRTPEIDLDNFYKILEVPQTASAEEIQCAYRQLIQVWHPDRFQSNPELLEKAEQKTKQLNEAFWHLSDPQRRARHDESLDRLRADTVRSHESPPGPSPSQQTEEVAVVTCPNPGCEVGLRVPTKRRLKVVCPRCNTHFMYDSTLESTWNAHVPESNEHSGGRQAENPFTTVVNSGLRKPIFWVTSVTGLVIVWAISVMAIVFILNSEKLVSQPSLMSPVPHQTSPPKEEAFLVPPTQSETQDTSSSSHVTPEADRDMSQPIPRIERQPISLATGVWVGPPHDSDFHGLGKLRIVNGTSLDALVRLGKYAEHGSLLESRYVKAGDEFTINDIGEGGYRLAFSLGIDWDQDTEEFRQDKVYTVFDEPFEFKETTEIKEVQTRGGSKKRTSIGFVEAVATLHGVLGGHAKTSSIDKNTFDRLFDDRD